MAGEMAKTSNFEAWYAIYPNKKAKGDARKAYEKAEKEYGGDKQEFFTMLMVATKAQLRFRKQQQGTGVFVPSWRLPATWIRSESWADEVAIEPRDKGPTIGAQCSRCARPVHGPRFTLCAEHEAWKKDHLLVDKVIEVHATLKDECTSVDEWRAKFKELARIGLGGNCG